MILLKLSHSSSFSENREISAEMLDATEEEEEDDSDEEVGLKLRL